MHSGRRSRRPRIRNPATVVFVPLLTGPALDARVVLGGFPMTLKRKGGIALLGFFLAIHSFAQTPAPATKPAAKPAARPKAAAAAVPGKPEKVTTVEGITEYRLANGLRVLLFPDPG